MWHLCLYPDLLLSLFIWGALKYFLPFAFENQMKKEAEKTAVTKIVAAADKAKEQELKSRTREVMTMKQEQVHITHEQVKMVFDVKLLLWLPVSIHIIMLLWSVLFLGQQDCYHTNKIPLYLCIPGDWIPKSLRVPACFPHVDKRISVSTYWEWKEGSHPHWTKDALAIMWLWGR